MARMCGRIPLPAREDRDELKSQPNFYWNQEDYLRSKQRGAEMDLHASSVHRSSSAMRWARR